MNFGPVRSDVNARWDLASHDVSIGCYLLDETPTSCNWLDFKRNKESKQDDSTVGIIQFSDTSMQVSASWHYGMKNRMYIFEFDNTFIHWDDNTSTIMYGSEIIPVENYSPLHNSIEKFLAGHFDQRKLTLNITKCLLGRL